MKRFIAVALLACIVFACGSANARERKVYNQLVVPTAQAPVLLPAVKREMAERGYRLTREAESFAEYEEAKEKCFTFMCIPAKVLTFDVISTAENTQLLVRMFQATPKRYEFIGETKLVKSILADVKAAIEAEKEAMPMSAKDSSQAQPSVARPSTGQ